MHSTLADPALRAYVAVRTSLVGLGQRLADDDRGEGIISAAIAVLIMAFLGGLMWVGFQTIWGRIETGVNGEIDTIVGA